MINKAVIPVQIKQLAQKFSDSRFSLYLVGGSVRDFLLDQTPKDWDFTTDAQPEEILKIIPEGYNNNKFGTVGLNTNIGLIEITTMRKEGDYKDHRHPSEVGWTDKIDEDLGRRDFTMNAIAFNLCGDEPIVDPFDGKTDLEQKSIKAVGDPNLRFQEDALRMLRAVRFSAQLDFSIEQNTYNAIKENKELLKEIAWERIRDELFKLLATDNAYQGIINLKDTGLLDIILPELIQCFGLVQEGPKHDRIYDIGEHSLLSLKFCSSKDSLVRFATLLHDIGKPNTYKVASDGNVTFYNHDVVGGQIAKNICRRFNLSREQTDKVYRLVRWHMFTISEN